MARYRVPFLPKPAPRMRVTVRNGKPRSYPDPKYAAWLREVGAWWDALNLEPSPAPLIVELDCFIPKARTTKRSWPQGDIDNIAKACLDSANGRVYVDDDQILELVARKHYIEHGEEGFFVLSVWDKEDDNNPSFFRGVATDTQ